MVTFDFNKTPITQVADAIIIDASNRGASDIHLDPRENGIMTRIRVDGDLVDYAYIPKMYERNLTTRLKLMSNMNITENRLPQDGAIKGKFGDKDLDMRVSCLPTNEGEKIVIRILDYSRSLSGLDKLGFNQENYQKLLRMIGNPNGIILITGATGSGKSTTVYSILQALNKEETNIITVEDPIEMNIEGMNQVQVNSEIGLDFAVVLRSILRQDPNVILIGEIRDSETAQIAVRASITGHLVLSTIHTNNSLSTIERLLDMNVERYLLSSALTGIISQRLAKMLCPKCRVKRKTTPYEKKVFKMAMKKDVEEVYDANHNGCSYCHKGYRGRIAIQEVLEITEHIKSTINRTNTDNDKLRQLVYGSGNVITLLQDGLGKVLNGFTTFEEIYRIIEIDNDIEDSCLSDSETDSSNEEKEKVEQKNTVIKEDLEKVKEDSVKKEDINTITTPSISSATAIKAANNQKETGAVTTGATNSIMGDKNLLTKIATPPIVNEKAVNVAMPTPIKETTKDSNPTNLKANTVSLTPDFGKGKTATQNNQVKSNESSNNLNMNTTPSNTEEVKENVKSNYTTDRSNPTSKENKSSLLPDLSKIKSEKQNNQENHNGAQSILNTKQMVSSNNSDTKSIKDNKEPLSSTLLSNSNQKEEAIKVPMVPVIDKSQKLEVPVNKTAGTPIAPIPLNKQPALNKKENIQLPNQQIVNNQNMTSTSSPITESSLKEEKNLTAKKNEAVNTLQNSTSSNVLKNQVQTNPNNNLQTSQKQSSIEQINNFFSNNLNTSSNTTTNSNTKMSINNQIPISSVPNAKSATNTTNKPNINNLIFPQNKN